MITKVPTQSHSNGHLGGQGGINLAMGNVAQPTSPTTGAWARRGSNLVLDLGWEGGNEWEVVGVRPTAATSIATSFSYPYSLKELDGYFDDKERARARRAGIAAADGDEESNFNSFIGLVYRLGYMGHFPLYAGKVSGSDGWHGAVDIPIPKAAVGKLMMRSIADGVVLGSTIDTNYFGITNGGVITVVEHTLADGRRFLVRYVHLHNLLCTELTSEERKLVPTASTYLAWSPSKQKEWTAWLARRPRIPALRPGTKLRKGQPLGPLGYLHSGHHLHFEIISRDAFTGLEPSGTRPALVAQGHAIANRYRSVRGDTKGAYWGPAHRSSGWIWYHPLYFLHALAKGKATKPTSTVSVGNAQAQRSPAPAPSLPMTAPAAASSYRKFRLTHYYVADQAEYPMGSAPVPIYNQSGKKIAEGSPGFFANLSLEGTGKLTDGRLINVTGKWVPVDSAVYAPVLAYHRRYMAKRPTQYSGLRTSGDRVTEALAFAEIPTNKLGRGYGMPSGIPSVPFRTLAADVGHYGNSEPKFRGKGGLVPRGTKVFIKEFVGVKLPDNTVHDGWFVVNDTGGGIFGAHFDVFAGTRKQAKAVKLPGIANVWYRGIETRIPQSYSYGLYDS